jgi:hypothetical protein
MTNKRSDAQEPIELSTVYFYKGAAPSEIALKDCGLQAARPIPGAFAALYGYQGKQEGFVAAATYAAHHGLGFTIIDFEVRLDFKQNPLIMKPLDLDKHDFVIFPRISRDLAADVNAILEENVPRRMLPEGKPQLALAEHPQLIATLMDAPGWEHFKVLTFAARMRLREKPLNIAVVPFRHWDSIISATCRLDPSIRVTLEAPEEPVQSMPTKTGRRRAAS